MRSLYQQRLWERLDAAGPEPIKDWLIFDGWEPEIEEEYGTIELDDDTCEELVRKITGREPVRAYFDQSMNGIEYLYEEEIE